MKDLGVRRAVWVVLIIAVHGSLLEAQGTGTIVGHVRNAATGGPVPAGGVPLAAPLVASLLRRRAPPVCARLGFFHRETARLALCLAGCYPSVRPKRQLSFWGARRSWLARRS